LGCCLSNLTKYIGKMTLVCKPTLESNIDDRIFSILGIEVAGLQPTGGYRGLQAFCIDGKVS